MKYNTVYENGNWVVLKREGTVGEFWISTKTVKNPLSYMRFKTKKSAIKWIEDEIYWNTPSKEK